MFQFVYQATPDNCECGVMSTTLSSVCGVPGTTSMVKFMCSMDLLRSAKLAASLANSKVNKLNWCYKYKVIRHLSYPLIVLTVIGVYFFPSSHRNRKYS